MSNELATIPSLAPSTMEQALSFAQQMSEAKLLPAHLIKSPADCLRVVLQAARWQMDPFAVADKTSIISGKMMYEGQLVSAVVNARGNLSSRLNYTFKGEGDNRVLTVSGTIKGENDPRVIELPFSLAKKINKNGQMNLNPDQQATYIGARIWARRHMPELMLGVYTPDEIDDDEIKNVTDTTDKIERPKVQRESKGAKAALENDAKKKDAVIDVQASATPAATPEKTAEVAKGDVKVAGPVTALKDAETTTFDGCVVEEMKVLPLMAEGVPHPGVKARISGPFEGTVYDMAGGAFTNSEKTDIKPSDAWEGAMNKDAKVKITLLGKKRKDGAVAAMVSKIELIEDMG